MPTCKLPIIRMIKISLSKFIYLFYLENTIGNNQKMYIVNYRYTKHWTRLISFNVN